MLQSVAAAYCSPPNRSPPSRFGWAIHMCDPLHHRQQMRTTCTHLKAFRTANEAPAANKDKLGALQGVPASRPASFRSLPILLKSGGRMRQDSIKALSQVEQYFAQAVLPTRI
jgi:hypothetical protein